jgi:hypothetical protein
VAIALPAACATRSLGSCQAASTSDDTVISVGCWLMRMPPWCPPGGVMALANPIRGGAAARYDEFSR